MVVIQNITGSVFDATNESIVGVHKIKYSPFLRILIKQCQSKCHLA
jgi:hypothetical protein